MKFNLTKPCPNCPFRRDSQPGWLGRERMEEITGALLNDGTFACHKTTQRRARKNHSHCAGALLFMQNTGTLWNNRCPRFAKMFLGFDETKLSGADGVFSSVGEILSHHNF